MSPPYPIVRLLAAVPLLSCVASARAVTAAFVVAPRGPPEPTSPATAAAHLRETLANAPLPSVTPTWRWALWASPSDEDEEEGGDKTSSGKEGGREWLREAMGTADAVSDSSDPPTPPPAPLRDGLAGFAVDPARGFGAVLVAPSSPTSSDDEERDRRAAVFAVVSPRDRTTIMSAEALTLVQLAGGIDVAAAVFPPDALSRAAFDGDEEEEEAEEGGSAKASATLVGIEAVGTGTDDAAGGRRNDDDEPFELPPSSPEREAKLAADVSRFLSAARNLPGLAGVTEADVLAALRLHADDEGGLDRSAFSEVLEVLRRSLAGEGDNAGIGFVATVAVRREDGALSTRTVEVPAFTALALSMRHGVVVSAAADCLERHGFGVEELRERLPAFRPMEELEEDARAVDGFVPEMFFKHKPPEAE